MEESKDVCLREPKLRHFVVGAVLSGISILVVLAWIGRPQRDPFDDDGTVFLFELAVLPVFFGLWFAGFVRWFTDIEFWRCLRASLIALGGFCLVGLAISVVWFGSIEGEYGLVLGYTFSVVASYYGLGAFGTLSLLVAMGAAAGFGLSNFGQLVLADRTPFKPLD
jgi:hypothetical protein